MQSDFQFLNGKLRLRKIVFQGSDSPQIEIQNQQVQLTAQLETVLGIDSRID